MLVKICGITSIEVANQAIEAGADLIGFVFANSKREIAVAQAEKISREIPKHVKKVGVFVNESLDVVQSISKTVGLDYVQLHGDESPAYCAAVSVQVIKAFQIQQKEDLRKLDAYDVAYFLLDSPAGKYRGGNGESFDWSLVKDAPNLSSQFLLAGGLRPDNVQLAIKEVQPTGVDVSSGVETDGVKDPNKITAFITEAKKER
ncbi:phosphoribosylanthranilate isomerase [Paraliobacillus ryukyuensis]|uniref:phosphoribosylanthranilate isomerase n=1 Tax=Paraliobacillus ryukyuensis TaxID=200904 RepID=UPI0009A84924|nr:phosphoribosylanthranilate isomerase [Paraliobacillus ryukyuensis]